MDNNVAPQGSAVQTRLLDALARWAAIGAGTAAVLMTVHVVTNVIGRYAFDSAIPGTLGYVTYWWLPCLAILAMAYTEARDEHVRVTFFRDSLTGSWRRVIDVFNTVLALLVVLGLLYYSFADTLQSIEVREAEITGPTVVPIWPIKIIVSVSLLLYSLQLLGRLYRLAVGRNEYTQASHSGSATT